MVEPVYVPLVAEPAVPEGATSCLPSRAALRGGTRQTHISDRHTPGRCDTQSHHPRAWPQSLA